MPIPSPRPYIDKPWLVDLVLEGKTPAQLEEAAELDGRGSGGGKLKRRTAIMECFENCVGHGILSRADIYFSVPAEVRHVVASYSEDQGRYWAPGARTDLFRATRDRFPTVPPFDIEVCLHYGPVESLLGDLYILLRQYELVLSGAVRGVLVAAHGAELEGWWKQGVPLAVRARLVATAEEHVVQEAWQLATYGDLQKVLSSNGSLFSGAFKIGALKPMTDDVQQVSHIRNAMMHPLKRVEVKEGDFELVISALRRLSHHVQVALGQGKLHRTNLPGDKELSATASFRRQFGLAYSGPTSA